MITFIMNTRMQAQEDIQLIHAWDMYYRLPKSNDWTINGYFIIQRNIHTVGQCLRILTQLEDETIKGGMFYIMRSGIQPIWECKENAQGGFFSFRIYEADVWRNAIYALCGDTLFENTTEMNKVNGISITPKNGFMTLKLWLATGDIVTLAGMTPIPQLDTSTATFRYHNIQTVLPSTTSKRFAPNSSGQKHMSGSSNPKHMTGSSNQKHMSGSSNPKHMSGSSNQIYQSRARRDNPDMGWRK